MIRLASFAAIGAISLLWLAAQPLAADEGVSRVCKTREPSTACAVPLAPPPPVHMKGPLTLVITSGDVTVTGSIISVDGGRITLQGGTVTLTDGQAEVRSVEQGKAQR
jgi:hypothetical protein